MLTSSHLPVFMTGPLEGPARMLGMPRMLGNLPTFLNGPVPHLAQSGLELAGIAAGLAASLGSIALGRKRKTRKYAKIAAGLGGLAGLASTVMGGKYIASDGDYASGGLDVGAGLAMIGAAWHGWKKA